MEKKKSRDGRFLTVENKNGPVLGFCPESGVEILEQDGCYFKDLAKTGELLPYEDWRLSADQRAKDLASRMTVEQIAGLMLYSPHQMVPAMPGGPFPGTYHGKPFPESGEKPWALSDQQKDLLGKDHIRHILAMKLENADTAARWNNEMQAMAESLPLGLPVNTSSDPRHGAAISGAEYRGGAGGDVSKWPEGLAMSATFSPELCRRFGEIASREYRAMGIATALSPQIDLATEPRWMRFGDTFGEHRELSADMARAYCDGMQTTENTETGWGKDSVNAMAKHWPGGGTCEGGRDAHYAWGKYAVYPGGNFEEHLTPFLNGAFRLDGPTEKAAAIMPYYSVSWGQDSKNGENVGNSYNEYIIHDLLREKYGYDGVVCTDWGITADHGEGVEGFASRCWGVEELSEAERHLRILMNGVDQFGGNAEAAPVLEAYRLGCEKYGEETMRRRFEESAVRLLKNSFRCGLFENPYLEAEDSAALVGCEEFCREGYEAQLKSVILLKNKENILPLKRGVKVYVPSRHIDATPAFFRNIDPARDFDPVPRTLLEKYFTVVDSPEEADVGLVFIETPITNPYEVSDREQGGNGYLPVSLQFRPYTAKLAREHSIAGGDPYEDFTDRAYKNKTVRAANESDLDNILDTRRRMGNKPVIVIAEMNKPMVMAEFEEETAGIVAHFGVQAQAVLDILTGGAQPSGLLPVQIPKDMDTVETQQEDVPFDMEPYTDECGNTYDFGFGLSFSGVISDSRTEKYQKTR